MSQNVEMHREMPRPFPNERFPEGLGAVVMKSVLSGERPVLQVLHDPENGWGFADGVDDPNTPGGAVAAHITHLTRLDPTLAEMAKLPPGALADRLEVGGEWHIRSFAWDEEPGIPDSQVHSLEGQMALELISNTCHLVFGCSRCSGACDGTRAVDC